jgi:hypothetical protein
MVNIMSNQHDRYRNYGERLIRQIDAELAAARADLSVYDASDDEAGAAEAINRINELDLKRQNLESIYSRYVQANQPYQPPPLTDSEMQALPPEKMSVGNALEMINRTSKYAKNLSPDDPYVRHGWSIAQQRRQRGE